MLSRRRKVFSRIKYRVSSSLYHTKQAQRDYTHHRSTYAARRMTQPNQTHEAKLAWRKLPQTLRSAEPLT